MGPLYYTIRSILNIKPKSHLPKIISGSPPPSRKSLLSIKLKLRSKAETSAFHVITNSQPFDRWMRLHMNHWIIRSTSSLYANHPCSQRVVLQCCPLASIHPWLPSSPAAAAAAGERWGRRSGRRRRSARRTPATRPTARSCTRGPPPTTPPPPTSTPGTSPASSNAPKPTSA